jgi:hypothetical protein
MLERRDPVYMIWDDTMPDDEMEDEQPSTIAQR